MDWDTAYINKLPNSAFAWIHPDYLSGKSKDKGLRKLPYIDLQGEVDPVHVSAALAYLPKTDGPSAASATPSTSSPSSTAAAAASPAQRAASRARDSAAAS